PGSPWKTECRAFTESRSQGKARAYLLWEEFTASDEESLFSIQYQGTCRQGFVDQVDGNGIDPKAGVGQAGCLLRFIGGISASYRQLETPSNTISYRAYMRLAKGLKHKPLNN